MTLAARPPTSAPTSDGEASGEPGLRRTLTLPWLVFYGVGVTVGAGIFALIGELVSVSGPRAPLAFLLAGALAGITSVSYRDLVRRMPRAGGEAIWVAAGVGARAGRAAGVAVVVAGIVSSAVVALAFGGYLGDVLDIPPILAALAIVVVLAGVACRGARESIMVGGVVTLLEVGTLILVIALGLPAVLSVDALAGVFESSPGQGFDSSWLTPMLSGAILAFFAFIGFEDIVNMAEETVDPSRTAPKAIAWTLGIGVTVYVLLAFTAVSIDDPQRIADSDAPMATLFEIVSGRRSEVVATIAAIAMTNGILAQIMMSSRVLFGMGTEGSLGGLSATMATVHGRRRTPIRATLLVATAVGLLVIAVPLVHLARVTSVLILGVFTLVNLAEVRLARRDAHPDARHLVLGAVGALACLSLAMVECVSVIRDLP